MKPLLAVPRTHNQTNSGGYVLLLSVLVVVVIGTAVATSLLLWSVTDAQTTTILQQSARARQLAQTCAEEALWQLQQDTAYAAGGTLTVGADSCSIVAITGTGGSNRVINASGTVGSVVRRVQVTVTTVANPPVIASWQEVADF
jgi:hypothetical protein